MAILGSFIILGLLTLMMTVAFLIALFQRDDADEVLRGIRYVAWSPHKVTDSDRLDLIRKVLSEAKR